LLAKNVNDNAGSLDDRGVLEFFASKLAPTREAGGCLSGIWRQIPGFVANFAPINAGIVVKGCDAKE